MVTAVCPGSFDPVHNGHLDVIERAWPLFDKVIVGVLVNPAKAGLFTPDERIEMILAATVHLQGIEVRSFSGLLVDFCRIAGAGVIVKGLRAVTDFEYEMAQAQMNKYMGVDTVFTVTSPEYAFVRSTLLKDVVSLDGSIDGLVPDAVASKLKQCLRPAKD